MADDIFQGGADLGALLSGGAGNTARLAGLRQGVTLQQLAAEAANQASQVPLHGAQTQQALAAARSAQAEALGREDQNQWNQHLANTPTADFSDQNNVPLGILLAAGKGGAYKDAQAGLGDAFTRQQRAVLADPSSLNTARATAAQAAIEGKVPTPVNVPNQYATLPGMNAPTVGTTPLGASEIGRNNATATAAAARAATGGPLSDEASQLYGALVDRGLIKPGSGSRWALAGNLNAMLAANPGMSAEDIADKAASGQLDFGMQRSATSNFGTGKNGNTVRSLNVAVQHLDTLGQLAANLNNTASPAWNAIANVWKQQTGQDAPTDFNTAKQIVADEVVKAVVGSGGAESDREAAVANIRAANSPQQLLGAINTYKQLMGGQLNGLRQQYEQTTGRHDFERFLGPTTQQQLEGHGSPGSVPAPTAAGVAAVPEGATAINRATGQRLIYRGGQWQPLQ